MLNLHIWVPEDGEGTLRTDILKRERNTEADAGLGVAVDRREVLTARLSSLLSLRSIRLPLSGRTE